MKLTDVLRKTAMFLLIGGLASLSQSTFAQEDRFKDYKEIYRDTTDYVAPTEIQVRKDTILDPLRVVTNKFGKNWFIFATGGLHAYRGDYSNLGKFSGTLSPDWSIGIGKWFTPGIGLKVEFIRSDSRGYTGYTTGHYGYGDVLYKEDGTPYRKMKTGWWDISGSAVLNLSRLFLGYEGYNSPRLMNQFMANLGIGGVHHLGFEHSHGSDNEWSGHVELQYSRFFNRKKRFSLDIKARGIFYQTNFDLEYGQADYAANKWDCNLGIDIGFTYYLGKQRSNGWSRATTQLYKRDYRERKILVVREKDKGNPVKYGTITFYVFYPNNYSGRNDAPQIQGSVVNALDYLAGGIFTQKQYMNSSAVTSCIEKGVSIKSLAIQDLPTETADRDFEINFVPRGYEMLKDQPMSYSLEASAMSDFYKKAGYYYAPIYDGLNTWKYRIDNETLKQQLLSYDNYAETASYGLNAHSGLDIIRQHMDLDSNEELVSFADVYAVMNSNKGYISQFTDTASVSHIQHVFKEGVITMIQVEGLATSQDNYTGANAEQVGLERNTALSQNRAQTVISWLKTNEHMKEVASQIYLVGHMNGIRTVNDKSTRGLNAKLNRCVKVRIHYMMQ